MKETKFKSEKAKMQTADIKIEYDEKSKTLTLVLSGELDHHSAGRLRSEADRELAVKRPKHLIIDVSSVSFMDSSGIGFILGRYGKAELLGATTSVKGPSQQIQRLLLLSGANKLVNIIK